MKKKISTFLLCALLLGACATNPQDNSRITDNISKDCTFQDSTYGGENVHCSGNATLSGADARKAVEQSRRSTGVQNFFGGVVQVNSFPGTITTSRRDRRLGVPKYMPRGGYTTHHSLRWGFGNRY